MALGRQGGRQTELMIGWAELPRSPGHAFYDRLQAGLIEAGFDGLAETQCTPYYARQQGRPSLPPGCYFRMHRIGYFEGIDSERGLEWRCADSLSLRAFLRLGTVEPVPDHAWLSRTPGSAGRLAQQDAWLSRTPGSAGPARGCRWRGTRRCSAVSSADLPAGDRAKPDGCCSGWPSMG